MIPLETCPSLITLDGTYIYILCKIIEHDNFFIFTHTGLFSSHNRAFGDEINQPTRPVFFLYIFLTFSKALKYFFTHYQGNPKDRQNIREAAWLISSCAKIATKSTFNLSTGPVHLRKQVQ